jgi:hypothetical protein
MGLSVVVDPWTFLAGTEYLLRIRFKTFDISLLLGYLTQPPTPFLTHYLDSLDFRSINFNDGEREDVGL